MVTRGWIVYVRNGGVRATSAVSGKTRVLGRAGAFAPSASPGDVWLEQGSEQPGAAAVRIRSVAVSGGRRGPPIALPDGTKRVAGTDALAPPGAARNEVRGPYWLWDSRYRAQAAALFVGRPRASRSARGWSPTAATAPTPGRHEPELRRELRLLRLPDSAGARRRHRQAEAVPGAAGTTGWAPAHGATGPGPAARSHSTGQIDARRGGATAGQPGHHRGRRPAPDRAGAPLR